METQFQLQNLVLNANILWGCQVWGKSPLKTICFNIDLPLSFYSNQLFFRIIIKRKEKFISFLIWKQMNSPLFAQSWKKYCSSQRPSFIIKYYLKIIEWFLCARLQEFPCTDVCIPHHNLLICVLIFSHFTG